MNGYTKLFSTIITSTIWQEPIEVKVLWITMLAMADKHGHVSGSIPGLAHVAGISIESCQKGIDTLSAPDPYSRTKAEGGRRIMATDGGWDLVNHAKYRELLSKEERRQYLAMKQRESRERRKAAEQPVNNPSTNVNERGDKSTKSTQAESDTKEDTEPLNLPDISIESKIYDAYPKHVGRKAAIKAICIALKATSGEALLAATQAYANAVKTWPEADKCYIPHPATWFNRGSYDDDPATWKRGKDDSEVAKTLNYSY